MPELLLIESRLSPCGWVKTTFSQHGCKVTRVLHVKQAERALRQCKFDVVLIASEGVLPCMTDVRRLRESTTLPLLVLMPSATETNQTDLIQAGVDTLICDNIAREALWPEVEHLLNRKCLQ
ncbi:DNA-binding response regulator [Enterovibrio sp. 27052020O]|uniref:DNA-binding response regulator n=1 Tax=Enterovibrio sp. 27052020O TaxID=3241166 RepID=UPI00388FC804